MAPRNYNEPKTLYYLAGHKLYWDGKPRPEGRSWQTKMKQDGWDAAQQAAQSTTSLTHAPDEAGSKTREPQGTPEGDQAQIDAIKKEEGK